MKSKAGGGGTGSGDLNPPLPLRWGFGAQPQLAFPPLGKKRRSNRVFNESRQLLARKVERPCRQPKLALEARPEQSRVVGIERDAHTLAQDGRQRVVRGFGDGAGCDVAR